MFSRSLPSYFSYDNILHCLCQWFNCITSPDLDLTSRTPVIENEIALAAKESDNS